MANLGAEVSRLIAACQKKDLTLTRTALERADAIIHQIESREDIQPRIEEIKMLSQAIHSLVEPSNGLTVKPQNLKSYFTPFAIRSIRIGFVD
jgi:plasmid stabilization system protein ParE